MRELERFQTSDAESGPTTARSSPVMTADEAARWLRLDDGANIGNARRLLLKLVTAGRLKTLTIGRRKLFTVAELTRFVEAETRVSDDETDTLEAE